MCRRGTRLDFLSEMHEDLINAFRSVMLESKTVMRINELCEATVNRPAKRFYISTMQAYKVIARMRKGDLSCLDRMPSYRKEMFHEMNRLVGEKITRFEFASKPLLFVVSHVVGMEAPRFYVSAETMRKLYYSRKRRRKN